MKGLLLKGLAIVVTVLTLVGLTGCIVVHIDRVEGSDNLETREYDFTDFTRVEISSLFQVVVNRENTYRVSITANDNLFDYIEVTRSGDTLRLRLKSFYSFHRVTLKATITLPDLRELTLSGASSGEVTGFQSNIDTKFTVSGASGLKLQDIKARDTEINVSGASRITGVLETVDGDFEVSGASQLELRGSAEDARLVASGASQLKLAGFYIRHASVNLSGASGADVEVNGRLDIEVSGASRLIYSGNPALGHVQVSGASTLSRR